MHINRLFEDFRKKYPKIDYFTQEEMFQYMRMAYCIGTDNAYNNTQNKPVIRSDGRKYSSIAEAARSNMISERQIRRSLNENMRAAGYYWEYFKNHNHGDAKIQSARY